MLVLYLSVQCISVHSLRNYYLIFIGILSMGCTVEPRANQLALSCFDNQTNSVSVLHIIPLLMGSSYPTKSLLSTDFSFIGMNRYLTTRVG